jgi:hypothetical protein
MSSAQGLFHTGCLTVVFTAHQSQTVSHMYVVGSVNSAVINGRRLQWWTAPFEGGSLDSSSSCSQRFGSKMTLIWGPPMFHRSDFVVFLYACASRV